jgi:hypothetical protein
MNRLIFVASALALSFGLIFSVSVSVSPNVGQVYGQQNQTDNATSTQQGQQQQQNETEIGSGQEIVSATPPAGGVGQQEEGGQVGILGGLEKEQTSTETTNVTSNQSAGGSG